MVVAAAGELNRPVIELMLHLASVGTFLSVGLKLPWGTWFGKSTGDEEALPAAKEPPVNMLLAMGLAAFLCLLTGVYPKLLYDLLPFPVNFHPYEPGYVVAAMQLLILTLAAFWFYIDKLMAGKAAVTLDTDWFYRMFGRALFRFCNISLQRFSISLQSLTSNGTSVLAKLGRNPFILPEMFLNRMRSKAVSFKDLADSTTDENTYRFPVGWGVCASVLFLFFYGMVYLTMV